MYLIYASSNEKELDQNVIHFKLNVFHQSQNKSIRILLSPVLWKYFHMA